MASYYLAERNMIYMTRNKPLFLRVVLRSIGGAVALNFSAQPHFLQKINPKLRKVRDLW